MAAKEQDYLSDRELEILRLISDGFSDREIAQKLYLSINTVKWHNRQIYQKLGVGSRTEALAEAEKQGLLDEKPQDETPSLKIEKHNLPAQVSSFVGREKEIEQIREMLEAHRLVTLTGPGGVGKTRLALEAARGLLEGGIYPEGIYFIELAPVSEPELVISAINDGLNLSSLVGESKLKVLIRFLKEKKLILVLDNFEHLLEGALLVNELLTASDGVRVLSTSREALKLTGEQIFPVLPLELQPSRELFVQRAREVNPGFNSDEKTLPLIEQICFRLDGNPLAIELAAARMKSL